MLADWLASTNNPYFAKNMANIVWAHFIGKGIIDPVDDVRISNPAINPRNTRAERIGNPFLGQRAHERPLLAALGLRRVCQRRNLKAYRSAQTAR